jgi:hypothetical protein
MAKSEWQRMKSHFIIFQSIRLYTVTICAFVISRFFSILLDTTISPLVEMNKAQFMAVLSIAN